MRVTIEYTEPDNHGLKAVVESPDDWVPANQLLDMFKQAAIDVGYSPEIIKQLQSTWQKTPIIYR